MRVFMTFCMLIFSNALEAQDSSRHRALKPDHVKLQFAGSIGFLSAGFGFTNRKENLEGDFYYGYLPESIGGITTHTLSSKLTWFPIKAVQWGTTRLRPVSLGVLTGYTFGKQYFLFAPKNYPYSYYDFPTALHFGVFAGGQVAFQVGGKEDNRLALYYEVGANDKDLKSYFTNMSSLSPSDILHLAIGVKKTL